MILYCPHEGLCLYLSLQESELTQTEFCQRVGITGEELHGLTLSKRIGEELKERVSIALELPQECIFNDRVKRVWSFHHPFSKTELKNAMTAN